jgi:two-component system nitrogen regulation response regulator GlnG
MLDRPAVLLIHDDPDLVPLVRAAAEHRGFALACASAAEAGQPPGPCAPDAVVLDLTLPGGTGLDAFRRIRAGRPRSPVVVLAAPGSTEAALAALREGAFDCLSRPVDAEQLGAVLQSAAEAARRMRPPSLLPAADGDGRLVARSPRMQEVCRAVARLAPQDVPVLILGEGGTGKELAARALYHHSRRAGRLLLAVRCGALPARLLEGELFGQEPGSLDGTAARPVGKLERCRGGTLLLDEVGDLPPAVQARLLGVLRDGCFARPGGAEMVRPDVRLLATTNQDLDVLVAKGRFLPELYARLRAAEVRVPPLRERPEDVPDLAWAFLCDDSRALGRELHGFTPEAMACLRGYGWPGNVRELRAAVQEAVLRARGPLVTPEALPEPLAAGVRGQAGAAAEGGLEDLILALVRANEPDLYPRVTQALDRVLLTEVLRQTRGNQKRASELLGIDRKTLRKKLQSTGLLPWPLRAGCPQPQSL